MEKLGIEPGSFMKNAGLVGLYKMLQLRKLQDENFSCDEVDMEKLLELDLTQLYVDTLIEEYGKDTKFQKAVEITDKLISELANGERGKNFKDDFKFVIDTVSAASVKSGFESIKDRCENTHVYEAFVNKKVKPTDTDEVLAEKLKELREFCEQKLVKETFMMKNIIYTVINNFWSNTSVLLRANAKKDVKETLRADFETPFRDQYMLKQKSSTGFCIECGAQLSAKGKRGIAFLNDMADDLARKPSAFWDCKVDAFVCPTCAFLYSIAPLGFRKLAENFTLINSNESIESLVAANMMKIEEEDRKNYHVYLNKSIAQLIADNKKQLSNIQVITRMSEKDRYNFTVIDRETVAIFKNETVNDNLNKLLERPSFKLKSGEWFNAYMESINNIFNYRNQYNLLNYLINESIKEPWIVSMAYRVFRIQCGQIEAEKGEEMKDIIKAITLKASQEGYEIRRRLIEDKSGNKAAAIAAEKQEEIIRGTVYQFVNALKVDNTERFMDLLIRVYSSYKREIPTVFIDMLKDEEKFNLIGYAFVLGLKGAYYAKNDETDAEKAE